MFHKTTLRLTTLYLVIIMVISLFFSAIVYTLTSRELDRGFRRQNMSLVDPIDDSPMADFRRQLASGRADLLDDAESRVLGNLILINLLVLVVGGGLSYLFAKQSLEPIEKAHKSLEQFTADASHELRTPIAAMKSEIEVALLQKKLSASEAKKVLESNLEELNTLTDLTDGLLQLARLEDDSITLTPVKIEPVISQAIKRVSGIAQKREISFEQDARSEIVRGHRSSLIEVFTIVLDNAVKYADEKSVVQIASQKQGNTIHISVTSTGPTIGKDDLDNIFNRFYRADTSRSKRNTKGCGLGLAIAKNLIERQGGTIQISSKAGKTTVTVSLLK
ncbi:HAMP domain-containing histidine kinase [Candidatus Saccharibacteria bacterium]|nr:HAMP domain-containing histidine kinase [Candidatus Saccharibacteria bacterium]